MDQFDLVVIGGGATGLGVALDAAAPNVQPASKAALLAARSLQAVLDH